MGGSPAGASAGLGRRLVEWGLLCGVILALALWFLRESRLVQGQAELAAIRSTVAALRTAMVLDHLRARSGNASPGVALAPQNPFDLLERTPPNYRGVMPLAAAASVGPGAWFFDPQCPCVAYAPVAAQDWVSGGEGSPVIGFRLVAGDGPGPRLFDAASFDARGFHDQTLGFLRYAQKAAIAQRRPVCVAFTVTGATLSIDGDRDAATGSGGCETALTGPRGDTPGSLSARGAVQFSALPTLLVFDGLGQPDAGRTIQVTGTVSTIVVEPVTGFVRD